MGVGADRQQSFARAALVGLLAVVAATAAPIDVAARDTKPEHRASAPFGFMLKASNGYSLYVYGFDSPPDEEGVIASPGDEVYVIVEKPGAAVYYVPDDRSVKGHSIKATIDGIAEIDVRYVRSNEVRVRKRFCSDKKVRYEGGHYEGVIEFDGEAGFAVASAARAAGTMELFTKIGCTDGYGEGWGPKAKGARLSVGTLGEADLDGVENEPQPVAEPEVSLEITENRGAHRARILASASEDRGSYYVARGIERMIPASWFAASSDLRTASFDPKAGPFGGSGSFRRRGSGSRWSGDLSVDFPGTAGIPFTGPGIAGKLVHATYFHEKPYPYD